MNVVIGIISRRNGIKIEEVLISKRPKGSLQGDLWEFPGGKIETEEAEFDALKRELKEELDINVSVAEKVLQFSHKYPEELIFFSVWYVRDFDGNATGKESQKIAWVSSDKLKEYSFPVANACILRWISQNISLNNGESY